MEPLRLRALSAAVTGLVAVAVVAVAGMIVGESALDADASAVELATLVVPVALLAAVAGFVAGWLWRLWWPGARTLAELERSAADLAAAREEIRALEARTPAASETPVATAVDDGSETDTGGAVEAPEAEAGGAGPAPSDAPADGGAAVAGSEAPTSPSAAPYEPSAPAPALTMDDVPAIDIDQATAVAKVTERF
ncbi:MAG TPA: hypothetical protein VLD62_07895, partial [Acidimicrobiia bacterium]|nr:hypothetical protein [Acidimicrobiia bacterium]